MKFLKIIFPLVVILSIGGGGYYYYSNYMQEKPNVFRSSGVYDETQILTDSRILAPSVTLSNKQIEGALSIESNGSADIFLDNMNIQGDITVKDAEESYTLNLNDVNARKIKIVSNYPMTIVLRGNTNIQEIESNQDITLIENVTGSAQGTKKLQVKDKADAKVRLQNTGLDQMIVDTSLNLMMDEKTHIEELLVNQSLTLVNEGTVGILNANADVSYLKKPETVVTGKPVNVVDANATSKVTTTTTTTSGGGTTAPVSTTTTKRTTKTTSKTTTPKVTTTTQKTSTTRGTVQTTNVDGNTAPVITAANVEVVVGAAFNPLTGVTVNDAQDGRGKLSDKNIISNDVNTALPGEYSVVYSFTDKGGMTTTFIRAVVVKQDPKKLTAVRNLRWEYDSEGALKVIWDYAEKAFDYNVYVNSKLVESGVQKNYAYVESYISIKKENVISVVAYPSPTSALEASVPALLNFKAEEGYVNMPQPIYADSRKSANIFFRFNDLFVNSRPINKVQILLERYEGRAYVPMPNVTLNYNATTDDEGLARLNTYAKAGQNFTAYFTQPGSYRLTLKLLNAGATDQQQIIEHKFDVLNADGSTVVTSSAPVVDDFYVLYYEGSSFARTDWESYLMFYMPTGIDLREPSDVNDLKVEIFYQSDNGAEMLLETFDARDLRISNRNVAANEIIKLITGKGENEAFDKFMEENFDKSINISAKITMIMNKKEYVTQTRYIRLI